MIFRGNCTALVTPFTKSNKVNFPCLKALIEEQIKNGTQAILVLGTTGESPTLTLDEKIKIVEFSKQTINKRVPLIVGAGSNNTAEAVKTCKLFQSLGADALLSITPYYNKATQNGLIKHFSTIAENVDLPIILYNVPARTGVNMLPKTVFELSKTYNIVGIKEASGNLNQMSQIINLCSPDFCVYSGDDSLTLPSLSVGSCGVFSVAANLYPKEINLMIESFFQKDLQKAKEIHQKLLNIFSDLFCEVNPIPIKTAMNFMNKNVGKVRLPLCQMTHKNKIKLINSIKKVGL